MIQKRKLSNIIDLSFIECGFKILRKFPNHFYLKVHIKTIFEAGPNANHLAFRFVFWYSGTCIKWPLLGPLKQGRYRQMVALQKHCK